jgi:hypothetical protein
MFLRSRKVYDTFPNTTLTVKAIPTLTTTTDLKPFEQIDIYLRFVDKNDDPLYEKSRKVLFDLTTFFPLALLLIIFQVINISKLSEKSHKTIAMLIIFAVNYFLLILSVVWIILFTLFHGIEYFKAYIHKRIFHSTTSVLKRILFKQIQDSILIIITVSIGFTALFYALETNCKYSERCKKENITNFVQLYFGYIILLVIPTYFKSINRYIAILNWFILTAFTVAVLCLTELYSNIIDIIPITILCLVTFISIYEHQRSNMMLFITHKEAILTEKRKSLNIAQKSNIIERKLNLALVHQMLPPKVVEAIRHGKQVTPESFEEVTIFFSDVVGFTNICAQVAPIEVVQMLNELYTVMDYCTSHFPLYKVETIGDAYMV